MAENFIEILIESIVNNWKKYLGCLIGFIVGTTIIKYGFLNALFIFAISYIGYKLGDIKFTLKLKKRIISKLKED